MSKRLLALIIKPHAIPKVTHAAGFPPELTDGVDRRQRFQPAAFLTIDSLPSGIFLNRYASDGSCSGDTWHQSVEDAIEQAEFEYEDISKWFEIPESLDDLLEFVSTINQTR